MSIYRYSGWDGNQDFFDLDAEALMDELGRNLMSNGDLSDVLRQMQRQGVKDNEGKQLPGLEELLEQLLKQKQSQLEKHKLNAIAEEIRRKLDRMLETERQGIQRILSEAKQKAGEESVSYAEAKKLMEMLEKMDDLESQLKGSQQYNGALEYVDEELLRELLGDRAADELERLRNIARILEEAGYIRQKDGKYELTPRGMRKIGQKALGNIFSQLKKDRIGGHDLSHRGSGGNRLEETKKYEFGDDFQVHLERTIMNSLYRGAQTPPLKLSTDDFEVYKTEALIQSATVLMLDLSLSMPMRGNFEAAKQVVIALDALIRSQYPRDTLRIVGFSSYAREIKKEDLSYMYWDEQDPYTNIHHGLYLARRLLARERCPNKQIILISDGEPTAHMEGGSMSFQYPPAVTLQFTLGEARTCTRAGIVINTFMLGNSSVPNAFVTQMARVNKGRVFFTSADSLGQYLLVDYIANKTRRI